MELRGIEEFYSHLAKEKAISENLSGKIRGISSEAELCKLIREEIIPLSKKIGYDFSENDLLEYEKMVAQKLPPEDLLDVSGGVSLKSALLSGGIFSLAMLGFGELSPMQADAMVPKAAVESATGGVVAGARNDAVNTVEEQVQAAIKPELKDKVPQEDVIQPLMRIISVSNTAEQQKEAAINLLLNLVSDAKKEDLKISIETIKSTLPADLTLTETNTTETLKKAKIKAEILTLTNAKLADKLEAILNRKDRDSFLKELSTCTNFVEVYKEINPHQVNIISEEQFAAIKNEERYKNMLGSLFMLYKTLANAEAMPAADGDGLTFDEYQKLRTFFDDYEKRAAMVLFELCTERGVDKFLFKYDITAESIQSTIATLRREAAPSGGLEADKKMVLSSTGKVANEAKNSQEIEISQTDYGYLLDAWNGAEALVYKLTGVTENFRFLNPTNHPTLEKKDGEKYFRWKYNEDSGDGFGELMRILFPCSDGQRIVVDSNVPNVPVFSRDCQPTAKLMAQIAAMLYKYRTATPDEKKQIKSELENFIKELNKNQVNKEKSELEAQKQNFETRFNIYIDAVSKLATEQKNIFNDIFDNTIAEKGRQAAKTKFENNLKALADSQKSVAEKITAANDIIAILMKDFDKIKTLDGKDELKQNFNKCKKDAQSLLDSLIIASGAGSTSNAHKLLAAYNQNIQQLETIAHLSNYVAGPDHFFARHFSGFGIDLSTHQGFVAANTLHRLLTSAFFAIDNQEYEGEDYNAATPDKFAPKYFVEKMLMNFCIEHFNVEPGKPNPLELFYNEAKSLIKHKPTAESLTQTKQSGERIENTLKLLNKIKVSELSPYTSGTAQNRDTYKIGPVKDGKVTFMSDIFQDCADVAVQHVVNLLGYSVNKNWNVFFDGLLGEDDQLTEEAAAMLKTRLEAFKSAAKGHTPFEFLPLKDRLQLFFYHQSEVGVDATDVITRTLWEYAICNMNDPLNLENGSLYQIRYNKGNYELDTGHINSLKLVYNIAKALGLGTYGLDAAKAAIDALENATNNSATSADDLNSAFSAAVQQTYSLINQHVEISNYEVSIYTNEIDRKTFKDVFGTANIDIKIGNDRSDFVVNTSTWHSYVKHDPTKQLNFNADALKSDVDKLLGKKKSGKNSFIDKNTKLNKFHMLFGDFLSGSASNRRNPGDFKEGDPQYYKDFQVLRFLKVAQGEEENTTRLKNELKNNPYVRDANVKINLREVQEKKTATKAVPLALFAYENYCKNKFDFFSGAKERELVKKEIDFLTKLEVIEKVEQGSFTFIIESGKAILALYEGEDKEINIPQTVNGCPVTKIGDYCFFQETKKRINEKVTIPSTVEEIGEKAFYYGSYLNTVEFAPNNKLKIIGENAFESCRQLSEITIPKSVERIEANAFLECSMLENIDFENREKSIFIEPSAFSSCQFSNIDFPHNVEFGNSRIGYARNLKALTFTGPGEIKKENILKFLPYHGAYNFFKYNIEKLFDGKDSMQIDDKLTIDLWGGYLSEDGTLDLSSFDIETFKTFKFAKNDCVKKVTWPQGIDAIPEEMFSGCGYLEEITIPNTVNEVGKQAFYWCANLAKVTFEAGRTENLSIDSSIFEVNRKLTEVTIVDKITLYTRAFDGGKLEKIVIDTDAENVQFNDYCFGYKDVNENLRIYVRDNTMKEKITKNELLKVKPKNVIVGLPQGNE